MKREAEEGVPEAGGPEAEAGAPGAAAEIAEPAAELVEVRDRWLRAEAEIQNVRRRAQREREELRRELEDQWLLEAAAVLDDLDRGLAAARASGAPEAWTRGFELSGQRLRELLERYGMTAVEPVGQLFDPRLHEAMLEVDGTPGMAPGTVAQVVTRGYARNGRSLRAARVAVTRGFGEGESES
ncbi:MAG: nucleotide exchange factor GrpE [Candidatus Eisenbacteria bacterium]